MADERHGLPRVDEELRKMHEAEAGDRTRSNGPGSPATAFPDPINVADLTAGDPATAWLWQAYLARGEVTLLSALWKSGKTTLLAHLLKALVDGRVFLDYPTQSSSVLYVTEEGQSRWAQRRDEVGLAGAIDFLIRPFQARPRFEAWVAFVAHLGRLVEARPYDLVVLDTLAHSWPVRDENDAAAVQSAMMPLHGLFGTAPPERQPALLLVHHNRKSDGVEATASRGSGALPAFVDCIVEFRRYDAASAENRKRVLTGYGRHDETPSELVVELTDDGYVTCGGSRNDLRVKDHGKILDDLLPGSPPGQTVEDLLAAWPGGRPQKGTVLASLKKGIGEGRYNRSGEGKKGSPYAYWSLEKTPFTEAPPPPQNPGV